MEQRSVLAFCAAAFAILGLWALMSYGDDTVRRLALLATFCAAAGQFIGQGWGRGARIASVAASYLAFGLALIAIAYL